MPDHLDQVICGSGRVLKLRTGKEPVLVEVGTGKNWEQGH